MATIGERIRQEREAQGISRAALGAAVGRGYSYIAELENDGIKRGSHIPAIAKALGVTPEWLETGKGDKRANPAVQSHSQSMKLDPVILAESIAALRQVAKRRGWDYDPETHAESTCYAYELWHELPAAPSTADVIDIGERIAERLRMEMEGRHGSGESGSGAGAGADDRGRDGTAGARKTRAAGGSR